MPIVAILKAIPLLVSFFPDLLRLLGVVKELNSVAPGWRKTLEALPDVIKTVQSAKTYSDYEGALDKLSDATRGLLDNSDPARELTDTSESLFNKRK